MFSWFTSGTPAWSMQRKARNTVLQKYVHVSAEVHRGADAHNSQISTRSCLVYQMCCQEACSKWTETICKKQPHICHTTQLYVCLYYIKDALDQNYHCMSMSQKCHFTQHFFNTLTRLPHCSACMCLSTCSLKRYCDSWSKVSHHRVSNKEC